MVRTFVLFLKLNFKMFIFKYNKKYNKIKGILSFLCCHSLSSKIMYSEFSCRIFPSILMCYVLIISWIDSKSFTFLNYRKICFCNLYQFTQAYLHVIYSNNTWVWHNLQNSNNIGTLVLLFNVFLRWPYYNHSPCLQKTYCISPGHIYMMNWAICHKT